jgi:Caenorhabditis protein of unknown function, DUF268
MKKSDLSRLALVHDDQSFCSYFCVKAPGLRFPQVGPYLKHRTHLRELNHGSFYAKNNTKNFCNRLLGLFAGLLSLGSLATLQAAPPRTIPEELYDAFTLNGQVPVSEYYFDDTYSSDEPRVYTIEQINQLLQKISRREIFYYYDTDTWLYAAFDKYADSIEGKQVAVMGSALPTYESIVLAWKGFPTTIEYGPIVSQHPFIRTMTVGEYEQDPILFDAIVSISSYEHDGLARYGDPLNPIGDLLAMEKTKRMLKKDGLLFLAVPIGRDRIWWNAHRVYGSLRFPMLIDGWEIVDSFGFNLSDFNNEQLAHQPIFVLRVRE